jgi:hypothetical protein
MEWRGRTSMDDVEVIFEIFKAADSAGSDPSEDLLIPNSNTGWNQFI